VLGICRADGQRRQAGQGAGIRHPDPIDLLAARPPLAAEGDDTARVAVASGDSFRDMLHRGLNPSHIGEVVLTGLHHLHGLLSPTDMRAVAEPWLRYAQNPPS